MKFLLIPTPMTWRCRLLTLALFFIVLCIFIYWEYITTQHGLLENDEYTLEQVEEESKIDSAKKKPLILVWTRIFREQSILLKSDCPLYENCTLTYDHSALPQADAVIFHVPDIKWLHQLKLRSLSYDQPDLPDLPVSRGGKRQRLNVFLTQENPSMLEKYYNTKELSKKSRNYFHWVMSYLRSSHVQMPYGGFWVPPNQTAQLGFPPVRLPNDRESILRDKRVKGILWMVSNCESHSKREVAMKALASHIPITIVGKCAPTGEGKRLCPRDATTGCEEKLLAQHYFYMAAENDICRDYVTEKFWGRYKHPSVPIVMRKHVYQGIVPNNSYIAMDDFGGPREMAAHLHRLMDNPDEYMHYFEWRSQYWSIAPWNHAGFRIGQCALCERLLRLRDGQDTTMPSPLPDAVQWFQQQSQCEGGTFAEQWAKNN